MPLCLQSSDEVSSKFKTSGRQDTFGEFIHQIFEDIVPNIRNSLVWQRELQAAQRHVLSTEGLQSGVLKKVIAHMNYAPQRILGTRLQVGDRH